MEKRKYDKKEGCGDSEDSLTCYDYLLKMEMQSMTMNKIKNLNNDIESKLKRIEYIKSISENQMWLNDIEEFEKEYLIWMKDNEGRTKK
jgi:hypothetical protein